MVWADALLLDDEIDATIQKPFALGGAACLGTLIYRDDDAQQYLDEARNILQSTCENRCSSGATCLNSLLIIRFMGSDAAATRRAYTDFWSAFRAAILKLPARLPRVWET